MNSITEPTQELQLYDNYGLWHTPFWQTTIFKVAALCASLIAIALTAYLIYRYVKSRKKVLSPTEQALHDLHTLKKKGLCAPAHAGAFYVGLTSILKKCMSSFYNKDVRSFTDSQMTDYVATLPLFDQQKDGLTKIFSAGELIKFAQQNALEQQMNADWQFSVDFIKNSRKDYKNV